MAKLGEILKKFQCPVCKEYVVPPIPQCANGHVICQQCQKERDACPLCGAPFSKQRNQTLEAIANDVPFPCKYSKYGCEELKYLPKKESHERECPYQPLQCPYCSAEVASYPEALLQHLSKVHENKPIFQNCVEIGIKIEDLKEIQRRKPLRVHCIMEKFSEVFIFSIHYVPEGQEWYFLLQVYGQASKADCYRVVLEMSLRDKRVIYEGKVGSPTLPLPPPPPPWQVLPWLENLEGIVSQNECLVLTDRYFRGGFYGGILKVDVRAMNQGGGSPTRRRRSPAEVMTRR